jgi:signal transduction histidine kinase
MSEDFADEISAIADINAVSTILETVCLSTGMGFAAIARVTEARWVALAVRDEIGFGLAPGSELKIKTTICDEIRQSGCMVVIDHVTEDDLFRDHATPRMYGFESYISVPIILKDGSFFGTLCAIDPSPARLNRPETIGMFKLFAELLALHLNARRKLLASETQLDQERQTSELRDQFIAVLGHDLRNPLAAIDGAAGILLRTSSDEKSLRLLGQIRISVTRMARLINDVLDFARGRLGGGLSLASHKTVQIAQVLDEVISELQIAWPERQVYSEIDSHPVITGDQSRIAQLISNLIANALTHGSHDKGVRVTARMADAHLEISVINSGEPIPDRVRNHLFEPFVRARSRTGEGLGLGLYIAKQIALAHGGSLDFRSDEQETCFTLRLPLTKPVACSVETKK